MTPPEKVREPEERRHARALSLEEATATASDVIALLGDPSWRVRKATVMKVGRFVTRSDLVAPLVAALGDAENAGLRSACADVLTSLGDIAVPDLVSALSTPDVDRRKFVVEVLGGIGKPRARDSLIAALDDSDENVRAAVIAALARFGGAEVVSALRQRLSRPDAEPQLTAYVLHALSELEADLRYEELEPFLARPELARLTYPLLGACSDARAVTILIDAIGGVARGARMEAIRALARLHPKLDREAQQRLRAQLGHSNEALKALEEATNEADDGVAEAACFILGRLLDPQLAPRIIAAAASRPFVKTAIEAVRPLGPGVVAPLLSSLEAADTEARVLALEVIESIGDASAVPQLLAMARGVDARAAEAAVSALGKLGGADCIESVIDIARQAEPELIRQAALALAAIGMRHPGAVADSLRAALAAGDARPEWLVVLGILGRTDDMSTLVGHTHHRDPDVRRAAIEALSGYGDKVNEDALVMALTDENAGVRAAAARALGSFKGGRVVDALLVSTGDADPLVVAAAVSALGSVGGERATKTLLAAATGSSAPVAIAALQGLFRLRPSGLDATAERALGHADPEVVREAIVLTMRLTPAQALPLLVGCLTHRSWHVRLAAVEMLANRDLAVSEDVVLARLEAEQEPLVREALTHLARVRGVSK
jgi:HEAT repeat protein